MNAQESFSDLPGNEAEGDTVYFEEWLPEYEVSPCLQLILNTVVEAERKEGYLSKSKFFAVNMQLMIKGPNDFPFIYKCLPDYVGYYQVGSAGYFYLNMRLGKISKIISGPGHLKRRKAYIKKVFPYEGKTLNILDLYLR